MLIFHPEKCRCTCRHDSCLPPFVFLVAALAEREHSSFKPDIWPAAMKDGSEEVFCGHT
jgi:hypothetical protein